MTIEEYIKSKEKFRLMPFVTIYTAITERDATAFKTLSAPSFNSTNNFVTVDSFNALKCDVEALSGKLDELKAKPIEKSKKTATANF